MKKESEHHSDKGSADDTVDVGPPCFSSTNGAANLPEPINQQVMPEGTDHFDLLQSSTGNSSTGPGVRAAPDVTVTGNGIPPGQSDSVDLIDFGTEITPSFSSQPEGNRDSAISTSSSARLSSISSNRSSGVEFGRGSSHFERGQHNITEEDSGFDFPGVEHLDTPGSRFRPRSKEIAYEEKRRSTVSRHDSTSSGTITGTQVDGSNRDSQASFLSFSSEFLQRSGSSSTADEEREAPQLEKKASRAVSLKRRFKRKSKVEKGSFSGEDDFNKITEKKDKGFLHMMRKGRSKDQKTSKASGVRVYEKLAEKTLDALEIEVEVKTTKGKSNH